MKTPWRESVDSKVMILVQVEASGSVTTTVVRLLVQ
jgi:hypothetical protein